MNELEKLLEKAEELDWSYNIYDGWVELEKYSPCGEDFVMAINFDSENQDGSFMKNLKEYMEDYDPDEHAELWIGGRGKNGVPSSIRELIEDAEAIGEMIKELYSACEED